MASFNDRTGRAWSPALTVGDLPAVRDAGFDPAAAAGSAEGFASFFDVEPEVLVRVLWVLCRDEAQRRGVKPEEFGRLFDGDALESAAVALAEAACDFFRNRPICRALRGRIRTVLAATPDPTDSTASAGASPANSGWTPGL